MKKLDDQIREHYTAKSMSDDRVAEILASAAGPVRTRRWIPAIAAAVLIFAVSWMATHQEQQITAELVFDEIAMNHAKALDVEVSSNDYAMVQRGLDRIPFNIRPGQSMMSDYTLVGGRYCSIAGRLAAQLKLRHVDSEVVHTLYVTDLTPALSNVGNRTSTHDIPIRLWAESDRFFGLAGERATQATTEP